MAMRAKLFRTGYGGLLAFGFGWAASGIASAQTVGMATSPPGSITYSIGAAVAKVAADRAGLQMRVQTLGGQNATLPGVNSGDFQFGSGNIIELGFALEGKEIYAGPPLKDLRVVNVLMPLQVAFFVESNSPIKSIAELRGKRVGTGFVQQRVLGWIVESLLANGGLDLKDVVSVPVNNVVRGGEDFAQGRADVMFYALGAPQVQEVGTKKGGLRALPIDPSAAAMDRTRRLLPPAYAALVQPAPELYGIAQATQVLAFDYVLLSSTRTSGELVYRMAKALHSGKSELLATFRPLGKAFSPDLMAKRLPSGEYHAGAIKFYTEIGNWPPRQ